MPRPPRLEFDGALSHLFARGNRRGDIFRDDMDFAVFLKRMQTVVNRFDAELYAFVLMPNHFHFVLRRRHDSVGHFMQALLSPYARYFNRKYSKVGHLFQGRYRSLLCDDETYLLRLIRYVHRNPSRSGLCDGPVYPWSSYLAYLQTDTLPWLQTDLILSMFGSTVAEAREAFRRFHEETDPLNDPEDIFEIGTKGVLGDERFVERVYRRAAATKSPQGPTRAPLDQLLVECLERSGNLVSPLEVRGPSRRRIVSRVRGVFVVEAVRVHGYTFAELSGYLRRPPTTVQKILSRRLSRTRHGTPVCLP